MVFGFDPRKLVLDEQDKEKKKTEEVISQQERADLLLEKTNAAVRKKSFIKESLDKADKAIREVKFADKYGLDKWYEAKKKEDAEFELPDPFNLFDDAKTVEQEYGDQEEIKPEFASSKMEGPTGL